MIELWWSPAAVVGLWFGNMVLASVTMALLYVALSRRLSRVAPENRNVLYLLIALSPLLWSLCAVALAFAPEWAFLLVPSHCHGNLCSPHEPVFSLKTAGGVGVILSAVVFVVLLFGLLINSWLRNRRLQRLMGQFSTMADDYRVFESGGVQAWCAGLLKPAVFVSQGAIDTLDEAQLRVVLAHEYGHLSRRDNLRRLVAASLTLLWVPGCRRRFLADFNLSAEQACDRNAAAAVGNTALVIETLSRLAREHGDRVAQRERDLQRTFAPFEARRLGGLLSLFWLLQFVLLCLASHQLVEWLLPVV